MYYISIIFNYIFPIAYCLFPIAYSLLPIYVLRMAAASRLGDPVDAGSAGDQAAT